MHTTRQNIVSLAKKLITIPSTADNIEAQWACISLIKETFSGICTATTCEINGKPALILSTSASKKTDYILAGHIDVVSGTINMFKPRVSGGVLLGRGAYDMKASLAMGLYALTDAAQKHKDISYAALITSDEETDGCAMNTLVKKGYRASCVILPDGGNEYGIVSAQKGFLQLQIILHGKSAHASTPWEGLNPFDYVSGIVDVLAPYTTVSARAPWCTTAVLTKVESINGINQIPASVSVFVDIRYTTTQDVMRLMRLLRVRIGTKGTLVMLAENDAFILDTKDTYLQTLSALLAKHTKKQVRFVKEHSTSDAIFFAKHGMPVLQFRPRGGGAHQEREYIDTESLYKTYLVLLEFFGEKGVR